jgi:hypothetical protein
MSNTTTGNKATTLSNTTESQQNRLIAYLKEFKRITTIQARQKLDILHPAGRIKELRDLYGFKIVTHWTKEQNHRIAVYVLEVSHE